MVNDTKIELKFIINDDEKSELAAALDRYIGYVLQLGEIKAAQNDPIKILLIEVRNNWVWDPDVIRYYDWETGKFYADLQTKKNNHDLKFIMGILFFSLEEFPRGDGPGSAFNRSRMLREFFENSFAAVTANHENLFCKLYTLIYKILKPNGKVKEGNMTFEKVLDNLEDLTKLPDIDFSELSKSYPFGGVHTRDGHNKFREFHDALKNNDYRKLGDSGKEIKKFEKNYDLASIVSNNSIQFHPFKILIIDDNHEKVFEDIKACLLYFPVGTKIYITLNNDWMEFFKNRVFWKKMYEKEANLKFKMVTVQIVKDKDNNKKKELIKKITKKSIPLFQNQRNSKKFKFNYIVVDLLFGNYNEGNQIINNLVSFRNSFNRMCEKTAEKIYFDIIVLSLSEEVHDISRALNEGSLCYVPKKRIYMLPAVIAQLEKSRQIIEFRGEQFETVKKSRNFGKLYRLPEVVKRKLQNEPFLDLLFPKNFTGENGEPKIKISINVLENLNRYIKEPAKKWIKNMPKANLHCHLGGSIEADTTFYLSLNMVSGVVEEKGNEKKEKIKKLIIKTINFINIILNNDLNKIHYLFKILKKAILVYFDNENHICFIEYLRKKLNICLSDQEFLFWYIKIRNNIQQYFGIHKINPSEADKLKSENIFFDILKSNNQEIFSSISPIYATNVFNVIMGILEGKNGGNVEEFWSDLKKKIITLKEKKDYKPIFNKLNLFRESNKKNIKEENIIDDLIAKNKKVLREIFRKEINGKIVPSTDNKEILKHFISAEKRNTKSLTEYLGGCAFMGSDQLQRKENLLAALYSIIEKNVKDNVRYLEIRLSPDGYAKEDLTLQEAVQTLLLGTDSITLYFYEMGKYIRVNYIFSIKRHKSPKEAALEISAAIANREREKIYRGIRPEPNEKDVDILKYEWKPAKVVGIDLAGLEKENPARNFVNDFFPLFKTSTPITIHAGEEDTAQSIWEAVYLLHANRIGHGLTLSENPELKDMFKNMQICVEMNPISNTFTNPHIRDRYPLYEFFIEGLNITINTDNPSVSESTLSDEFVEAGELFQKNYNNIETHWISKWETLRIIKNSFSSSFLDREERRQLIRGVEGEIYQKIIKDYGC